MYAIRSYYVSKAFTRNIGILREGAERFSEGDLTTQVAWPERRFPDETSYNFV